jgi:hypothetical protein
LLKRTLVVVVFLAAVAALPATASASQLIDRNAKGVKLAVNRNGVALLTYRSRRGLRHVLAWGAINAIPPSQTRKQRYFRLDYSGGWRSQRRAVWKRFRNVCGPYEGPELHWVVKACTMPDGTHWALQRWQRLLPMSGQTPRTWAQRAWDLRLSHWSGELAQLEIKLDWVYSRRYDHLYGRYTYRANPIHGFRSTPTGGPLDGFGRNIYVDSFNSAWGPGWKRANGFLAHRPTGAFCYGFYPRRGRPPGRGEAYRAIAAGPGVTPDVVWSSPALGGFDPAIEAAANAEQDELFAGSRKCQAR